jgi:hypothetical protein
MLNKNTILCPQNNCYVYFQDLELRKNPLSESSFNLEGNLKIGKDIPKGFLTKIYHLYGGLEIRESFSDQIGNNLLFWKVKWVLLKGQNSSLSQISACDCSECNRSCSSEISL